MKNFALLIILIVFFTSCKKEQAALQELDCSCAKELSAEFKMEEIYAYGYNWERRTETADTSYGDKNVSFYAKEDNAEYTWYIGNELIKTREVIRYFSNSLAGQTIPITLVTKKKANLICFPNDDGYDSVTHYLTIVQLNTDIPFRLEGEYKVKSPLLLDSTIITITKELTPSYTYINIFNYDGLGSNCIKIFDYGLMQLNYRDFYTNHYAASTQGDYLHGSFKIYGDNTVFFDLTTGDYINGIYTPVVYYWNYKGRKL